MYRTGVTTDINIDVGSLIIEKHADFTRIRLPGYELSRGIGAPELPVKAIRLALPYDAQIADVQVVPHAVQELPGRFLIAPVQPRVILSQKEVRGFSHPDEIIYESDMPYPWHLVEFAGARVCYNHQIYELLMYPLQYPPHSGTILFYHGFTIIVTYEGGSKKTATRGLVQRMVVNPEDVVVGRRAPDFYEYVVMTNHPLDTVFQRF